MRAFTRLFLVIGTSSLLSAAVLTQDTYGALTGVAAQSNIVGAPSLLSPNNINDAAGPFRFPAGIGLDGTVALIITQPGGTFICSGAMIGPSSVLSAAHCFTNGAGTNVTTKVEVFAFPGGVSTLISTTGASIRIPDSYNGSVISDFDIAVINLPSSFGTGVDIYDTFGTGDAVSTAPYTVVGFGRRGEGATGSTQGSGSRRRGFNTFDFFNSPGVLISDFDNGLVANDASCFVGARCHLGLGAFEASTASGDSGGPVFLNGKIVAVTSFGARAGSPPDIDGALNSTFGEFNGFVYTGFHEEWIASMIPEPGTWLLSLTALAALAAYRRRSQA